MPRVSQKIAALVGRADRAPPRRADRQREEFEPMYPRNPSGASLLVLALACLVAAPTAPAFAEEPKAEAAKPKKKNAEAARPDGAAAAEAAPAELPAIDVTARGEVKPAVPENIPATVVAVDKETIATQVNAPTTAAALKYLPSVEVRERFIGDRNGILSTRTTGTLESARSLVYADGLLLSNLIGNSYSYPPRWGAVSPWEIERVDMVYGPFSAAYPGNAMGGVAAITTRMPDAFEAHGSLKGFAQPFSLYGTKDTYPGYDASFAIGNKFERFSFRLGLDHLDARGQPMSYSTANTPTPAAAATGTVVSGANFDTDGKNVARTVFGATSMDHTIQDTLKFKAAFDVTDEIVASYTAGLWHNTSYTGVESYLKRADGTAFYARAADCKFSIASGAQWLNYNACQNPGSSESTHLLQGASIRSNTGGVFDFGASVSAYDYLTDDGRAATKYGQAQTGTRTDLSGTGWYTGDLEGIWRPETALLGKHEVTSGLHWDLYRYRSTTTNTSNWSSGTFASANSASRGETQTGAIYIQDAWKFAPKWTLTAGLRGETWRADDGNNFVAGKGGVDYVARSDSSLSPKIALAFQATDEILVRGSYGRAKRYPTVTELFQSVTVGSSLYQSTPNLKPENIDAWELAGEFRRGGTFARLSGFLTDNSDAIAAQQECTDATCLTKVTWNDNVGKVRIWGAEAVVEQRDAFISGLDLRGSATLAFSRILENAAQPTYVGNQWPRIPRWRAKATASYRFDEKWIAAMGLRYSSGGYNSLDNSDTNWSVYGESSPYLTFDAKLTWKVAEHWGVAFGVDNITNAKYYVAHPYPQRTFFSELKIDF